VQNRLFLLLDRLGGDSIELVVGRVRGGRGVERDAEVERGTETDRVPVSFPDGPPTQDYTPDVGADRITGPVFPRGNHDILPSSANLLRRPPMAPARSRLSGKEAEFRHP
jgi:hypothetical protein